MQGEEGGVFGSRNKWFVQIRAGGGGSGLTTGGLGCGGGPGGVLLWVGSRAGGMVMTHSLLGAL